MRTRRLTPQNSAIEVRLSTDRTQYPVGRAVDILFQVINNGSWQQVLNRYNYEIVVRENRSRKVVWTTSWSKHGQPFNLVLQPGERRNDRELWDRRDDKGQRVPAGVYNIEARVGIFQAGMVQVYLADSNVPDDTEPRPRPQPPGGGTPPQEAGGLQATLVSDRRSARPGESLRFIYTIRNQSREPLTWRFSSGLQADLELRRQPEPNARYREGALTIWRFSQDRAFVQMLTGLTLRPGESKSFAFVWPVGDIPAGRYTAAAYLTPVGNRPDQQSSAVLDVIVTR